MTTPRGIIKMGLVFTFVMGFFVLACHAETLTMPSERYAADLEQKQLLLESIREDSLQTDNNGKDVDEKVKEIRKSKTATLERRA